MAQIFQATFIYYLYFYLTPKFEAIYGTRDAEAMEVALSAEVGLSRFMCGVLLHYALTDY